MQMTAKGWPWLLFFAQDFLVVPQRDAQKAIRKTKQPVGILKWHYVLYIKAAACLYLQPTAK
jgi:hypothetical protein